MHKRFLAAGAFFACLAAALGAFGAHQLNDALDENSLKTFHTGVEYQFYHALALLILGILLMKEQKKLFRIAGYFFIAGIILFSGSLYLLATATLTGLSNGVWVGPITPLGGLCFITGWIILIVGFLKR